MQQQQGRRREAERQLGRLQERHAQALAPVERAQADGKMQHGRQQQRELERPPEAEEDRAPGFHGRQ
jgi:hypothetical protein